MAIQPIKKQGIKSLFIQKPRGMPRGQKNKRTEDKSSLMFKT